MGSMTSEMGILFNRTPVPLRDSEAVIRCTAPSAASAGMSGPRQDGLSPVMFKAPGALILTTERLLWVQAGSITSGVGLVGTKGRVGQDISLDKINSAIGTKTQDPGSIWLMPLLAFFPPYLAQGAFSRHKGHHTTRILPWK